MKDTANAPTTAEIHDSGARVKVPVTEHRDRVWPDRYRQYWLWDVGRQMWLCEERGEADQGAWLSQEQMIHRSTSIGPFSGVR